MAGQDFNLKTRTPALGIAVYGTHDVVLDGVREDISLLTSARARVLKHIDEY